MLAADKIPPSNTLRNNKPLTGDLSPAQNIIAGAGSPLRSPEIDAGKSASASSIFSGDAVHGPAAAIADMPCVKLLSRKYQCLVRQRC